MDKENQSWLEQRDRVLFLLHQISFPGVMFEEVKFPYRDGYNKSVEDVDDLVTRALLARHDNETLLEEMSLDELVTKEGELTKQYLAITHTDLEARKEKQYFFNRPEAEADYREWVTMPYWTIDEAVALSYGKNPAKVTAERLASLIGVSHSFPGEYANRVERVKRALHARDLSKPIRPTNFVNWANGAGIECPKPLSRLASANSGPSTQEEPVLPEYENLNWEEITISFLKDRLIEIEIRGKKTRNSADVLGLLSKTTGKLNKLGFFLLGLARGLGDKSNPGDHKKTVSDLRRTLKQYFKIETDPIMFQGELGYRSRIQLEDKMKAGDKRAEARAERSMGSLDKIRPNVVPSTEGHVYEVEYPFGHDIDDEAAEFLRQQLHGEPEE